MDVSTNRDFSGKGGTIGIREFNSTIDALNKIQIIILNLQLFSKGTLINQQINRRHEWTIKTY